MRRGITSSGILGSGNISSANIADLDGNKYFNVADNATLDFTTAMTAIAYIDLQAVPTGGKSPVIIGKVATSGNQRSWAIFVDFGGDDKISFAISSDGTNAWTRVASTGVLSSFLNNMVQVGVTYTGTTMSLYINGVLDNSTPYAGDIFLSTAPLEIGTFNLDNVNTIMAEMGFAGVSNLALNATEMLAVYNGGVALCATESQLTKFTSYWNLANATNLTGAEIDDQIGSNNLTNVGGTLFDATGLTVECTP